MVIGREMMRAYEVDVIRRRCRENTGIRSHFREKNKKILFIITLRKQVRTTRSIKNFNFRLWANADLGHSVIV